MDIQAETRSNAHRFQTLPGGKQGTGHSGIVPESEPDIICHYGVVVRCTSIAGIELVEFEFLPDAA